MGGERLALPEKQPAHVANLLDRLWHYQFEEVLKPSAMENFRLSLEANFELTDNLNTDSLLIQFFISESKEELMADDTLHWVGIFYDVVTDDEGVIFNTRSIVVPKDQSQDVAMMPRFDNVPVCVMQWSDIAWDAFNPDEPFRHAD